MKKEYEKNGFVVIDNFLPKDVYAKMDLHENDLLALQQRGYFCDVGTAKRLYRANMDLLLGKVIFKNIDLFSRFKNCGHNVWFGSDIKIPKSTKIIAPVLLDDNVVIGENCIIGPEVILGKNSVLQQGSQIKKSVVLSNTNIKKNQFVDKKLVDDNYCI